MAFRGHVLLRLLLLFAVAVGALGWSRDASASDCSGAWTTGPVVDARAGVTLESFDSRIECSGPRRGWSCRLRETYVVRGGSAAGTPAAVYFHPSVRAEVRIDGLHPVATDPPVLEGNDARMLEMYIEQGSSNLAFVIPTSPGMARRIVIETRVRHDPECHAPIPIERRHPLVSRDIATDLDLTAWGVLGLERTPEYTETRRARMPAHWQLDRRSGLARDRDGRRGEYIAKPWAQYRIERRPPITWGGPFAAVGVARRGGVAETKLRAGWEAGVLRRLMINVAVESDARRHLEIVPAFDLTFSRNFTRDLWFVPLPSAGLGAPVQIVPHTRGGVRGLVALHWPYIALIGFVDGYPPVGSQRRIVTGGAMLQIGI